MTAQEHDLQRQRVLARELLAPERCDRQYEASHRRREVVPGASVAQAVARVLANPEDQNRGL